MFERKLELSVGLLQVGLLEPLPSLQKQSKYTRSAELNSSRKGGLLGG